jgi:carbonic anhydrase/acetyltransferase-like protein (isoleucine patch superfamily)
MLVAYLDFVRSVDLPIDCAATAAIVGGTVAGPGLVLRSHVTLRADGEWVRIGSNAYIGERATAHIADSTRPVGGTLFVAAKLAKTGIGEITKALWPLLAAAIAALFVITYVPSLTTVVWRLVN